MPTVRSYVMAPTKRVIDHRTGHQEHDPQAVLDGELDDFIDAAIRMRGDLRQQGTAGPGGALHPADCV